MSNIEVLHREHSYNTLRIREDQHNDTSWCHMHADHRLSPNRACFSPALVEDILRYQRLLSERLNARRNHGEASGIAHVVLASDTDVFNLGGDLELFCRAIREGNREQLLDYARKCVRGVHAFHSGLSAGVHSIALVQGDALGGGFEAALSCHTIVAESGVSMGLPEVLFDLFPGMGAYSFLCKRISPKQAEKLMLEGIVYTSDDLYRLGLVDVLVPPGEGVRAVQDVIRRNRRIPHAVAAMHRVSQMFQPAPLDEMMRITEIWVDTAMQLGTKSLRTMERLARAQMRRGDSHAMETASGV